MRLRRDDNVIVIRGRDRGKQGRIQQVFIKNDMVLVEGVNVVVRHTKASAGVRQAGIIQKELPIRVSNVALMCPQCNRPARVASRLLPDGTKARVCKKCEEIIE